MSDCFLCDELRQLDQVEPGQVALTHLLTVQPGELCERCRALHRAWLRASRRAVLLCADPVVPGRLDG